MGVIHDIRGMMLTPFASVLDVQPPLGLPPISPLGLPVSGNSPYPLLSENALLFRAPTLSSSPPQPGSHLQIRDCHSVHLPQYEVSDVEHCVGPSVHGILMGSLPLEK